MSQYKPLSIREKGLKNHLGSSDYDKFVQHYEYQIQNYGKPNYAQLRKATGWSRQTLYTYVEVYNEELAADKQTD